VGKTTAARVLAMALNCERRDPEGEPCGTCDSCRRIWAGSANLDVVEIDAASNRGVDDARDLRERAMYAASGPDRYKVYIIDEAHMLTREAWNALLKILEEPPPRVVFVFATTEPPVARRCPRAVARAAASAFAGGSGESGAPRYVAGEEGGGRRRRAALIARVAAGGMRDALSLLDQAVAFGDGTVSAAGVREALGLIADETYAELLLLVADRRPDGVFPFVARLVDAGADLGEFVNGLGEVLRALMVRLLGGEPEGVTDTLRSTVDACQPPGGGDALRMLHLLQEAETGIRRSTNARLHVESLLLRFTLLDRTVELQEVLAALGPGAGRPGPAPDPPGGGPPAPAPQPRARRGEVMRDAGRSVPAAPPRPRAARSGPTGSPPDTTALRTRWPEVVEVIRGRRPLVAAALEHAAPAGVDGSTVTLGVSDSDVHLEGLERSRAEVEAGLATVFGTGLRVAYRPAAAGGEEEPKAAESRRPIRRGSGGGSGLSCEGSST
jgi:DNA polymerase-3 subunit gamma/tau